MSTARNESKPIKTLRVKLHNRRVTGGLMRDGSIVFRFRILDGKFIRSERIRLSQEAVGAMYAIMMGLTTATDPKQGNRKA